MSKHKAGNNVGANLPALVDKRLMHALSHVVRQHILLAAVQGPVSPKEISDRLGESLGQVSYYVRTLHHDYELLELVKTKQVRGAVAHYYRATEKTLLPAKMWRGLKDGLRAVIGAGQASDLFNDLVEALKAGKLQGEDDHISRTPLVLDAEGRRNVRAIAVRATREVEDEQQAFAERRGKANGDSGGVVGVSFAVLAFETAWEPADLHARAVEAQKAAKGAKRGKPKAKRKTAPRK